MANLLDWLLDENGPVLRYCTLVELLSYPPDHPEVQAARAAIPSHPPLAELLAAQKAPGYWVQRDYYVPKAYSTFWVLSVLAEMGLNQEEQAVRRGVEFMFTHQGEDGKFRRWRNRAGKGMGWEERVDPCTNARIVRFLIRFGYGSDPRTRRAIEWLLAEQRADGMWLCGYARGAGCLRATLDFLRVAVLDPETAGLSATRRAAEGVCDLLMQPGMGRYHVADEWTALVYPYFGYGVIPALDALGRLGIAAEHPRMVAARDYLLSRRLPDGSWPLDEPVSRPPLDFGQPGAPNPWLTLDALLALRSIGSEIAI